LKWIIHLRRKRWSFEKIGRQLGVSGRGVSYALERAARDGRREFQPGDIDVPPPADDVW
jgi:hypothetical protein